MGTSGRRKNTPLAKQLREEPYRFEFFQAVRMLERVVHHDRERDLRPVGEDHVPGDEVVRFRASPTRAFPAAEVERLKANDPDLDVTAFDMTVTFMGLYGPSGVLPLHYTQLVIDQLRRKNSSLRDFLDVFNHRATSLFFRAWAKYRLPVVHERAALWNRPSSNTFTTTFRGLVGFETPRLQSRFELADDVFLYFSGFFAHAPKNAHSLQALLSEFLRMPLDVQQFQGQWLYLQREHQSLIPSRDRPFGQNCQLGKNMIVGERVWSIESRFRIRIGPLSWDQFQQLMPGGQRLVQLAQLVRTYVGPSLDFDVQPVLSAAEVPELQLDNDQPSRLGYDTWLSSLPFERDVEDAVFMPSGEPTR